MRYLLLFLFFLFLFLVFRFFWRLGWGILKAMGAAAVANSRQGGRTASASGRTYRDPVCGTFVSAELSHKLNRGPETFHFCSEECRRKFEAGEPDSAGG